MNNEKSIDILNSLIEINNDRIEGYETASKETDEGDLKSMFSQFMNTSRKCKSELENEVTRLGGEPAEGTLATGKLYRVWMDLKAALTAKDRKAILSSCEFGEDVAVGTYTSVMKNSNGDLTPEHHAIINSQYSLIKAEHDKVKAMRDMAK